MQDTDFYKNLRLLCDYYPSIADVCRRLDINRSQFNKYLGNKCLPSRFMLKRICDFFGVEQFEISLPYEQFKRVIAVRSLSQAQTTEADPALHHGHIDRLLVESHERLAMYLGYYHEYYFSMSFPGLVLRGLVRLFADNGAVYYRRYERLVRPGDRGARLRCDYRGMANFLSDRIFLTDYESLTRNEITQTVLYPSYQCRVDQLTGLKLGVSAAPSRPPMACRVLWEYLGVNVQLRRALRRCRLHDPAEGAIDSAILATIAGDQAATSPHLLAPPSA